MNPVFKRYRLICLLALPLSTATLSAETKALLLDFGPNADRNSPEVSPAYEVESLTGTWNTVGTANVNSGLLFSDGSTASSVSLQWGTGTYLTTTAFKTTPSESLAMGGTVNTGVYAGDSVAKDGVRTSENVLALQVRGLPAGIYNIYVTARNTDSGADFGEIWAGAGATNNGTVNLPKLNGSRQRLMNSSSATHASWIKGDNYAMFTCETTTGQALYIANNSLYLSGDPSAAVFNSIEIVPTDAFPEPEEAVHTPVIGQPLLERVRSGDPVNVYLMGNQSK